MIFCSTANLHVLKNRIGSFEVRMKNSFKYFSKFSVYYQNCLLVLDHPQKVLLDIEFTM